VGRWHERVTIMKYCVYVYVNAKMRPVERGDKGEWWRR
jgi:hypothetical protein